MAGVCHGFKEPAQGWREAGMGLMGWHGAKALPWDWHRGWHGIRGWHRDGMGLARGWHRDGVGLALTLGGHEHRVLAQGTWGSHGGKGLAWGNGAAEGSRAGTGQRGIGHRCPLVGGGVRVPGTEPPSRGQRGSASRRAASSRTKRPLVPTGSRGGWAQCATLPSFPPQCPAPPALTRTGHPPLPGPSRTPHTPHPPKVHSPSW